VTHILLTGAGFTYNWGGWLSSEAFEYLLSRRLSKPNTDRLWEYKDKGGFEAAIERTQKLVAQGKGRELPELQGAVRDMFIDMQRGLDGARFESSGTNDVAMFLSRFRAIFTLNQDLFIERHYFAQDISLLRPAVWDGCAIPGVPHGPNLSDPSSPILVPRDRAGLKLEKRIQPYVKLHGSINWYDSDTKDVMIIGGDKAERINEHPILAWNWERFVELLNESDARLMIVGYGFGDKHVNDEILSAVEKGSLRIFVIAPRGLDSLPTGKWAGRVRPGLIGASRRRLPETLSNDPVERSKVDAFFRA
jgi:SIR2-like domain